MEKLLRKGRMALFTALLWAVTVIVASAAVPTTGAEAACLIDADTGRILYQVGSSGEYDKNSDDAYCSG